MKLAITTGDPDGIGPEITVRALLSHRFQKKFTPFVFRDHSSDHLFKTLEKKYQRILVSSLDEALDLKNLGNRTVVEILGDSLAPRWVESATRACLAGDLDGLVTGPLSKTLIKKSGLKDIGHTEILSRLSHKKDLFQGYLGSEFCVVLATAHVPLRSVSKALTPALLRKAILAANSLRRHVPGGRRPIGILGINPHAGEQGLIGAEEKVYFQMLNRLRKEGIPVEGPLVPDAAFVENQRQKYSVLLATYHDQGLIPFKMVHGRKSGAQITLGIPFVRTSVDHGTAKDIAGRNKADAGSMIDAIEWCLRLTKKSR